MSDSVHTYAKAQLAEIQLERALQLFLEQEDYVCAITLAGAAEELLGKLLEHLGETSTLKGLVDECVAVGRTVHGLHGKDWPTSWFSEIITFPRNDLKHIGDGGPVSLSRDTVVAILCRAITNYRRLTGQESVRMKRFIAENYGV